MIDFETTGIDALGCRAVSMAIVHCNLGRGNAEIVYNQRFNPGEPIPEGASKVHGIYDKDVISHSLTINNFVESKSPNGDFTPVFSTTKLSVWLISSDFLLCIVEC